MAFNRFACYPPDPQEEPIADRVTYHMVIVRGYVYEVRIEIWCEWGEDGGDIVIVNYYPVHDTCEPMYDIPF